MARWISVRTRKPPLNSLVMVCYASSYNAAPVYAWGARMDEGDCWLWGIHRGYGGIRLDKDAGWNGVEADDDIQVTHWMELPKPPAAQTTPGTHD
jgi:hypothetical protein